MVVAKFDKYLHHVEMSVFFSDETSVAYLKKVWIVGIMLTKTLGKYGIYWSVPNWK